jgi:Flp pilus assembly pilin Flp
MNLLKLLTEDESAVSITHYTMLLAIVSMAALGAMNVFATSFDSMAALIGAVLDAA